MVIRTSWLYSSFGNNFVKTMLRLGGERDSLNVVADQIGSPTYAGDLAEAIYLIIAQTSEDASRFVKGLYHFSNEGVASWYDFAFTIMEMAGITCVVNPIPSKMYPTPTKRPLYSVLNKDKIKATYGIKIPHWRTSLQKCIEILEPLNS
jgi:dTDP-4-dehydrorhamnose reductase